MRLKHIEVFNAVMLTGTVSGAARLLHVSQPAVTQTLQHADLQLGYALFTRESNRLVPTREAQSLYPEVQRLMTQIESVRRMAAALAKGTDAEFRVLVAPSLAVKALPDALQLFRVKYPDMPIAIRTLHSHEIARAVALQEADVGIVYGPLRHPGVHDELVATGKLVCVSRPLPGQEASDTVTLEELLQQPFVRIDDRNPLAAMLADEWERIGIAPHGGMSVQTHHIAMVLAESGFGPAIIDSFTLQASSNSLQVRTIQPEISVDVRALMPRTLRSPKTTSAFIAAFRQVTGGA